MPVTQSLTQSERPHEWLVDLFFERFLNLARQACARGSAHESLMALGDALVVSYQSRAGYAHHLAQAWLDPSRYAAASHDLAALGQRLVNSADCPESLELVMCWLSSAHLELLETLLAEEMSGSIGSTGWESSQNVSVPSSESIAA